MGGGMGGVSVKQPTTYAEREKVATSCKAGLNLQMPFVIDGIDNRVGDTYDGWPERLYVLDKDGKITFKGEKGPKGFDPKAGEAALKKVL